MTTRSKPAVREHDEQKALFIWSRFQYLPGGGRVRDYLFAIPNGGSRHRIEASRLKAEGVTAGVPDVMLAYPCGGWHGLFIEMKRPRPCSSKVSREQKEWIERLTSQGYKAAVCYGYEEAVKTVTAYLGL